jgi:hypothetical protein
MLVAAYTCLPFTGIVDAAASGVIKLIEEQENIIHSTFQMLYSITLVF